MSKSLHDFATEAHPLRVSAIPSLQKCATRSVLMFTGQTSDSGGVAAMNGSAFHCLVEAWHQSNHDEYHALETEMSRRHEWPGAEIEKSVLPAFKGYTRDPRNRIIPIAQEIEIKFELDPSPDDPTGQLIYLIGHIDQIRRDEDGNPRVWDMKLSRLAGGDLINSYSYQIAMYAIGATKYLGRIVKPGGIIRCSTYATKEAAKQVEPTGVFFPVGLSDEVLEHMISDVARTVAAVRRGEVFSRPGDWCSYCPVGHISRCVPLLKGVTT